MTRRLVPLLAVAALALGSAACMRDCVPTSLGKSRTWVDLSAEPDAHAAVGPNLLPEVEAEFRRRGVNQHPPGARPYQFLALSGGGMYGSFGVGLLCGWTETGTRPPFDVVSGISTGALMSTFAFLGPEYDGMMREAMVGVQQRDLLTRRSLAYIPFADAFFTSRPMSKRIEQYLTGQVIGEVAKAHAAGRRLYIGTTNLDTRGLIIWDMGAIASRGTPEAQELYCQVVLASSSVPGAFPPVRIPVQVDGKWYEELHVDGGVSDEVIFRAFMVGDLNRMSGVPGSYAPPGSSVYVVNNGKMYADPSCVKSLVLPELSASFRSIVYGKTRDELYRIYLNCLETNVQFRATAVPQGLTLSKTRGLGLTREDQEQLFAAGYRIGQQPAAAGGEWRDVPPGTNPAEQALPRSGTRFATPGGAGCAVRGR